MSHKGHPTGCEFTSKAACEKARRVAIGQCSSMLDENRQCDHWGVDKVEDRPYCGQHLNSVAFATANAKLQQRIRDEVNSRIDAYLAKNGIQPHVCGSHCEFSAIPL